MKKLIGLMVGVLVISGCATTSTVPPPDVMESSNEFYSVRASTNCDSRGCKTFDISINNKSKDAIKVDWNKSQFISNNQTLGGFWYEGVVIAQRNMPRAPDVIFSGGSYSKKIAPNNSMELNIFPLAHWDIKPMPPGEVGIYLVVEAGGKEVPMKLTTRVNSSK